MKIDKLIRSNRKTVSLSIDEQGQLIVRAPHYVSLSYIRKFINQKTNWIEKKQTQIFEINRIHNENKIFEDGNLILYLGDEYKIRLNGIQKKISLNGDYLEFPFKHVENAESYMIKWYKKRANEIIVPRVEKYAQELNLKHSKVGITSAKKRWGSCNAKGNINFSYRLIMTPIDVIDYVIVHELMHLKELNHSSKFWSYVESAMPDYKINRKWLKDNQHRMMIN